MPMRMLRTLATLAATFVPLATAAHAETPCAPPTFGNSIDTVVGERVGRTMRVGTALTTGDFNSDGHADLAVSDYANRVSILLGAGNGRFAAPIHHLVANFPRGMGVADFNGDGALDLAVAHHILEAPSGRVSILLGTGTGSFGPPSTMPAGTGNARPLSVATGDLNQDGRQDLVIGNGSGSDWVWSTASVMFGFGNGTFTPQVELPVGGALSDSTQGLTLADMNNDGLLDIVTGISILFGTGTGVFLPFAWVSDPATRADAVVVGHFDGNGFLDIARLRRGGHVELLRNTPVGYVISHSQFYPGFERALAARDFDVDGKLDLAVVSEQDLDPTGTNAGVQMLKGDGAGAFVDWGTFAVAPGGPDEPHDGVAADFDEDGRVDLAVSSSNYGTVAASVLRSGRCEAGGKAIRVHTEAGLVEVGWTAGRSQSGYFVLRTVDGVTTVFPSEGTTLPASAVEFDDGAPVPGRFNCYQVIPTGPSGPQGRSDMFCVLRDGVDPGGTSPFVLRAQLLGTAVQLQFGVPPTVDGGYLLVAAPLDGGPIRTRHLPTIASQIIRDETAGINTCYRVIVLDGSSAIGESDLVCAFPGRAVLGGS